MGKFTVVRVADEPSALISSTSSRLPTGVPWIPMPVNPMIIRPFQAFHCEPVRKVPVNSPCERPSFVHAGLIALG